MPSRTFKVRRVYAPLSKAYSTVIEPPWLEEP